MKKLISLLLALVVPGCATKPLPPQPQLQSQSQPHYHVVLWHVSKADEARVAK